MHAFPISTGTIFFQALLILAAVYYAMLLTNWGNPTVFLDTTDLYAANNVSFWIKLVTNYITNLIYLISLFVTNTSSD